jgi:hypothetical protein
MIGWRLRDDGDLVQSGQVADDEAVAVEETATPESATSESATPETPTPEAPTPEAPIPEAPIPEAQVAGQAAERGGWVAGVLHGLAAFGIYLAAWLIAGASPLVLHPTWAQVGQTGMDPNFYVWGLRWWPYAISHGLDPLHTSLAQVPTGVSLAWVTTIPPLAVLAWPITAIAGPVVSFNLLVAVSLPASAWAAFLLCRRITGRFWPSLAGGAIYGFSAYETSHILLGQLNLSFGPLLPLIAYLIVVRLQGKMRAPLFVGLLGLAMAAQCYLFNETFADLTVVLAAGLLVGYALAGRIGRPVVAGLARQTGLAYLLAVALAAPFLWSSFRNVPHGFNRSPAGVATDLPSTVIVRGGNALALGWLYPHDPVIWARGGFIGVPLLVIAVALAAFNWSNKVVRYLTVMLAFVIVTALGPKLLVNGQRVFPFPWEKLWFLPIIRSSFPSRLMVFAFLALAVITAVWLAAPSRFLWLRGVRWMLAIGAIAAIVMNTPPLNPTPRPGVPTFITTGEYRNYIPPGSTVVVVATHTGNAGLLWQAETGFYFKLAGGYFNEALDEGSMPSAVSKLIAGNSELTPAKIRNFRALVRTANVSTILVQDGSLRHWQLLFEWLGLTPQHLGGVTMYQISPNASKGT